MLSVIQLALDNNAKPSICGVDVTRSRSNVKMTIFKKVLVRGDYGQIYQKHNFITDNNKLRESFVTLFEYSRKIHIKISENLL